MEVMREHKLKWKKGVVIGVDWKTKKTNTHSGVDFPRMQQGWKELVFHFCDGRN